MIRAVIIDFDDTLCLTEAISFEIENTVLQRLGREPMARDVHLQTWGMPLTEAIVFRSPGVNLVRFCAVFEEVFSDFVRDGRLDAIPEKNLVALDALVTSGKQLAILTSRTLAEVEHLLEPDHVLASRISDFYHRDNMAFHKPDARAFDPFTRDAGLLPQECVYIGDSPGDASAANAAGLHFVACLESGQRSEGDFAVHRVDCFIPAFEFCVDAIAQLDQSSG